MVRRPLNPDRQITYSRQPPRSSRNWTPTSPLRLATAALPQALAVALAHLVAGRAHEAVAPDLDPDQAGVATPPLGLDVPLAEPLGAGLGALLGQVLLVVVPEVVAQALGPEEGLGAARALLVVAVELLLVLVADVHGFVVPVEVRDALEGRVVAAGRQADVEAAVVGHAAVVVVRRVARVEGRVRVAVVLFRH